MPGVYSIFTGINITSGVDAIQYDFCEKVGVMLSGYVYHDRDNDGIFDRDVPKPEKASPASCVKLLDGNGNDTGLRATTDATGFYKFNNLAAGKYAVMEIHPAGWLDGIDTPGNLGGVADVSPPGDMISQIMINWGQMGIEYNFGELLPGSHSRASSSCRPSPSANCATANRRIDGVQIDLLDASGNVHRHDDDRRRRRVLVHRPAAGHVQRSRASAGRLLRRRRAQSARGGGTTCWRLSIFIGDIDIGSGVHAVQYDFCEKPPAELSGYVFIDGPPIVTNDSAHAGADRRAARRPADARRHAARAASCWSCDKARRATRSSSARRCRATTPGAPDDPIRVVTDANGFYHFAGLRAGMYAVVEIQPEGVIDDVDTPGTLGGFAVNPNRPIGRRSSRTASLIPTPDTQATIEQFRTQFGNDAIVRIPLAAGEHSQENNFSEVTTQPIRRRRHCRRRSRRRRQAAGVRRRRARRSCRSSLLPPRAAADHAARYLRRLEPRDRLHVALERGERRLAAEHDAGRGAVPVDVGANRRGRLAERAARSRPLDAGHARRRPGRRIARGSCSAATTRSPVVGDFNGDGVTRHRRVHRRPVVPRSQRQRPLGRRRPVGPARHARTTCRSPAIGTPTARPTSASTARPGRAIRGRSPASRVCRTPTTSRRGRTAR